MGYGTRSQIANNASVGGTADTFNAVGNFDLSSDATLILGFWYVGAQVAKTATEAVHAQMTAQVGNKIRGPWGVGDGIGGGPATNQMPVGQRVEFYPLAIPRELPASGALGGVNVAFTFSSHLPDPTNAFSVVNGALYWEGPVQAGDVALLREIQTAAQIGHTLPWEGADTEANGAVTTDATAITNLEVQADADVLVGFSSTIAPDAAPTAGAEGVGWLDLTSSISDFGTQQYPLPAYHAGLGIPVGTDTQVPRAAYPAYIPTTGNARKRANRTVTPSVRVNATIDAAGVSASVYWR